MSFHHRGPSTTYLDDRVKHFSKATGATLAVQKHPIGCYLAFRSEESSEDVSMTVLRAVMRDAGGERV